MTTAVGVIAALLLMVGVTFLIAAPIAALVLWSTRRATGVRDAEAEAKGETKQAIQHLRVLHPELVIATRLDHHDMYVCVNIGLWMYGWGVLLASSPNSNLSVLTFGTQQALGGCLLVGTSLSMAGSALGMKVWRWRVARRVTDHLLSELLGDDVRVPYLLGYVGLLSTCVSLFVYGWTIWTTSASRLLGTLGGGLSLMIAVGCLTLGVRFYSRRLTYERARDQLIAEMGRQQ